MLCNMSLGTPGCLLMKMATTFAVSKNQRSILEDIYRRQFESETSSFTFIADDNVSGYKFERPGLYKLLSMIEAGKCNVIIAKDLSRIGRHSALTQLFIEQCERAGVRVHAMSDYDTNNESDDLILGIRAWSNERVVKDASAKINKVIRHKQETAHGSARPPLDILYWTTKVGRCGSRKKRQISSAAYSTCISAASA